MGLNCSHGCWDGSYSGFMEWRRWLAALANIDLDAKDGFGGTLTWDENDILSVLLNHSDCDGIIEAKHCLPLADRLEELLPNPTLGDKVALVLLGQEEEDWYYTALRNWINGLREAGNSDEDVEFG